ncbi:hypothetical protein BU198_28275 [Streptomyces sp. CBMA156]|nr:hypothetical protein [Streptomyces sp. CBMA156]
MPVSRAGVPGKVGSGRNGIPEFRRFRQTPEFGSAECETADILALREPDEEPVTDAPLSSYSLADR